MVAAVTEEDGVRVEVGIAADGIVLEYMEGVVVAAVVVVVVGAHDEGMVLE